MNVYFACSITGGREDEAVYRAIVDDLLAAGHEVPTAILASPEVVALEAVEDPVEVYSRDTAWIRGCDVLIAEVTTPSHGVGYEIGYALGLGKPVLCCYRQGVPVSKMILGNTDPALHFCEYTDTLEVLSAVRSFLAAIDPPQGQ